jgi:hypothetical protein
VLHFNSCFQNQLKQSNAHPQQHAQRKFLDPSKHGPPNKASPNTGMPPTNGTQPNASVPQRYCRLIQTNDNYKFECLEEAVSFALFKGSILFDLRTKSTSLKKPTLNLQNVAKTMPTYKNCW